MKSKFLLKIDGTGIKINISGKKIDIISGICAAYEQQPEILSIIKESVEIHQAFNEFKNKETSSKFQEKLQQKIESSKPIGEA